MSNRLTMGRRKFLVVSSTGAVATAVLGPELFAGGVLLSPRRLAVGYALSEENAAVTKASNISAADRGFIDRGARISVSRTSGTSGAPDRRRAVELIAHYSYLDGSEQKTAPFLAWGCSRLTGCEGNPTAFHFPLDEVQKISFTVNAESGAPAGVASRRQALVLDSTKTTELPIILSLRGESGAFKLARGFYVVAPMFDGDADPRWTAYTLRGVNGRWSMVDRAGNVAPFEHFVLRVDYAKA